MADVAEEMTPLPPLVAACDALVLKALEAVGKRLVRADRSRYRVLGARPFHEAHMLWAASPSELDKVLRTAWDTLPYVAAVATAGHGLSIARQSHVLDAYVRTVVGQQRLHDAADLARVLARAAAPTAAPTAAGEGGEAR